MTPNRMIGTVAAVHPIRGFFFIYGPDERDYIAFAKDMPNHQSLHSLVVQQTRIEFEPVTPEPPRGPAATKLVVLDNEEIDVQPEDLTARRLGFGKERRKA